jgi:hypothetical protein
MVEVKQNSLGWENTLYLEEGYKSWFESKPSITEITILTSLSIKAG